MPNIIVGEIREEEKRAVSEHFHFRALSEQFQSTFRVVSEQFYFRAISEQFQSSFTVVSEQFQSNFIPEQFQCSFRAVSEQFQSNQQQSIILRNIIVGVTSQDTHHASLHADSTDNNQ